MLFADKDNIVRDLFCSNCNIFVVNSGQGFWNFRILEINAFNWVHMCIMVYIYLQPMSREWNIVVVLCIAFEYVFIFNILFQLEFLWATPPLKLNCGYSIFIDDLSSLDFSTQWNLVLLKTLSSDKRNTKILSLISNMITSYWFSVKRLLSVCIS